MASTEPRGCAIIHLSILSYPILPHYKYKLAFSTRGAFPVVPCNSD